MVKFQLELIDDVKKITEGIRDSEPIKLSRKQFYNRILLEWAEMKGYIEPSSHTKKSELEALKKKIAELENQ